MTTAAATDDEKTLGLEATDVEAMQTTLPTNSYNPGVNDADDGSSAAPTIAELELELDYALGV